MAFDTSVSGILAASADLGIIGNNIANSSTSGFKSSQGEFTDLYAASLLGTPGKAIGQGVQLNSVTQDFSQGNIEFTNNALDMAINARKAQVLDKMMKGQLKRKKKVVEPMRSLRDQLPKTKIKKKPTVSPKKVMTLK